MWHFQFHIWLKWSFGEVHFAENFTWIRPVVTKLWTIDGLSEQQKTKEIQSFFWLYLTINGPHFWLILLDRNTYILSGVSNSISAGRSKYYSKSHWLNMFKSIVSNFFFFTQNVSNVIDNMCSTYHQENLVSMDS